jgi:hypothetical protein
VAGYNRQTAILAQNGGLGHERIYRQRSHRDYGQSRV